jgi:hypothetical protein
MNFRLRRPKLIKGDEWLTQYGNKLSPLGGRPFKNRPPNPERVNALSLIRGRRTLDEAARLVQTARSAPSPGSGVRYTTAARLIQEGFRARHTGTSNNPHHVSVIYLDETHIWTDDDSERFDACFDQPIWGEG